MTDDQNPAPDAGDEVVQLEAVEAETPEVADSTTGQEQTPPAEAETEGEPNAETEEKSKGAIRRERRKAYIESLQETTATAEREAKEAQDRLEASRKAAADLQEPKLEDFNGNYERHQAALSAFFAVQGIDAREATRLEAEAKERAATVQHAKQQQMQEVAQNWEAHAAEAAARYADFNAVMANPDNPIAKPENDQLGNMVGGSDVAGELAYHLGKDHDLAAKIAALPPLEMGREIGKLEAQLAAPKPKTTTTAPDPINPVKGKATAPVNPDEMSMKEYVAARQAGKIR